MTLRVLKISVFFLISFILVFHSQSKVTEAKKVQTNKNINKEELSIQNNPAMDKTKPDVGQSHDKNKIQEIESNNRFTPHISAEAQTRPRGKFSFQRAVGANLNTSMFLSAFTYSITNRVEFGTVLLNYLNDLHVFNFNIKYNFWRGQEFFWSVGFSFFQSEFDKKDLEPQYQALDLRVGINAFQLLLNYLPLNSKFKFGVNYNVIDTTIIGLEDEDLVIASESEFGLDVSYALDEKPLDITLGLGWLRQDGISSLEIVEFGFGSSVRWYRPEKLFSSPTAGIHYSPKSGSVEFLLSSSIY